MFRSKDERRRRRRQRQARTCGTHLDPKVPYLAEARPLPVIDCTARECNTTVFSVSFRCSKFLGSLCILLVCRCSTCTTPELSQACLLRGNLEMSRVDLGWDGFGWQELKQKCASGSTMDSRAMVRADTGFCIGTILSPSLRILFLWASRKH